MDNADSFDKKNEPQPGGQPDFTSHKCRNCDIVREVAFCAGLTHQELNRMGSFRQTQKVAPQKTIFQEGDPANDFFSISAGSVKLYKLLPDGRRQITGFLFSGDIFGLDSDGLYAYTAEAITPTFLCRFSRKQMEKLLQEMPQIEKRIYSIAMKDLAAAHEQILMLGRKTAREKLASFLLLISEHHRLRGRNPNNIDVPMNRADIADYLGLTIETVSRTFTQFKKEGILTIPDSVRINILELDHLKRLAAGE